MTRPWISTSFITMSTPAPAPADTNSSRTGYGVAPSPLRGNAKSADELWNQVRADLRPRFAVLRGPFNTRAEVVQRVNDFTFTRSLCPAGTWKNRSTRIHPQTKSRGEIYQLECANCVKKETKRRKENATFMYQVAQEMQQ